MKPRLFAIITTLVVAACSVGQPPALPEVDAATMSGAVGAQVAEALEILLMSPQDAARNGRLAMLLDTYGKTEPATALYARARHFAPETFRWAYLHARALAELGQTEAAAEAYQHALVLRPGYPPAELALAELTFDAGDLPGATTRYTRLSQRNPSYADAYLGLGRVYLEGGQLRAAIEALEHALALNGKFGQAHYVLSQAYRASGDEQLAATHLALFERYRLLRPDRNDPVLAEVEQLNVAENSRPLRGIELLGRRRFAEAAEVFEALAKEAPERPGSHHNLIAAYTELGQFERAEQHARLAAELDPDAIQLHDNLGILRLRQQRVAEAEAAFRRAIEIDPQYSVPHRNLGAALAAAGRTAEAIEAYSRALELEPTDRQTRFLLGRLLAKSARAGEAVQVLGPLAGVLLADTPLHLQELGNAQLGAGRFSEAIETLRRAQELAQVRGLEGMGVEIGKAIERAQRLQQR